MFESALKITDKINQLDVDELGSLIAPSKTYSESQDHKEKDTPMGSFKLRGRSIKSREIRTLLKEGNAFLDKAKYAEAIILYDKTIEKDSKHKSAWINARSKRCGYLV